jgi:hypothetical protein
MQIRVHNLRSIHVDTLVLVFFFLWVKFYHLATKKKEGSLKPTNHFFCRKNGPKSPYFEEKKDEVWTPKYA